MTDIKRRVMGAVVSIRLGDLLREHCKTVDGFADYEDGWDDERIITEFERRHTAKLSPSSVITVRTGLMGPLPKAKKPATLEALQRRIEALEDWASKRGPGQGDRFHKPGDAE